MAMPMRATQSRALPLVILALGFFSVSAVATAGSWVSQGPYGGSALQAGTDATSMFRYEFTGRMFATPVAGVGSISKVPGRH